MTDSERIERLEKVVHQLLYLIRELNWNGFHANLTAQEKTYLAEFYDTTPEIEE